MSDWQPISDLPRTDMPVLVYFSARVWLDALGNEVSFGSARDYVEKIDIGFFKGSCWHESGTGHDMFESWREESDLPTHWMPLPAPPSGDA